MHRLGRISFLLLLAGLFCLGIISCGNAGENQESRKYKSLPEGDSLIAKAEAYRESGNLAAAEENIRKAFTLSIAENNEVLRLSSAYQTALLSLKKGDNKLGLKLLNYCIRTGKDVDMAIYVNSYIHISYLHQSLDNPWLSMAYLYEALEQSHKVKDGKLIRNSHHHLGLTLYQLGQYTEARKHFLKGLSYYYDKNLSPNEVMQKQEQLSNIGLTYFKENQFKDAILYYDSAEAFIKSSMLKLEGKSENDGAAFPLKKTLQQAFGVVVGNEAQVYDQLGQFETADSLIKISLDINARPGGEQQHAVTVAIHRLEMYLKNHPEKITNDIINDTRHLVLKYGNSQIRTRFYKALIAFNGKKGDEKEALQYVDSLLRVRAPINALAGRGVMYEDVLIEMGFLKQEQQLHDTETELQSENDQKRYILITGIFVLILLVVMVYLYNQNARRRRNLEAIYKELNEQTLKTKAANEELLQLNNEKNHILAVVAHDLRNPVSTIKGLAALFKMDIDKPEELHEYIGYLDRSSDKAIDIINDLLETASLDSGQPMLPELINLENVVSESFTLMAPRAKAKGVWLGLDIRCRLCLVNANKNKLIRVIDNLLSNSIKFTKPGGKIDLNLFSDDLHHTVEIVDSGIGMNEDQLKVLFDRFTKAGRYGTNGEVSHGMGMSIVKKIIDMHGGTIEVESSEEQGTRILLKFKVALGNKEEKELSAS